MRLCTAALTLAMGLGAIGAALGDEGSSPSWFARMVPGLSAKPAQDSAAGTTQKSLAPPAPSASSAERLRKAKAAWLRRQEVCLALRELADKLDDDDLRQKVEVLEQKARDAYMNATNSSRVPSRPGPELESTQSHTLRPSAKESP